MFGLSKREISNKIAEKVIKDLQEKGFIRIEHIGTLRWTAGDKNVRFEQDENLINELQDK